MVYLSRGEAETEALGARLAQSLTGGAVVALCGDLGAGKTAFIRGMARGLGVQDRVTSPTFTIVNEYEGALPLFHFDLYRLAGANELFEIGWDDYLERGGVCAVEWSERAPEVLADRDVKVQIRRGDEPEARLITIEGADFGADFGN